jgi:hypothetical protein
MSIANPLWGAPRNYNEVRTHLSLEKDAPVSRAAEPTGTFFAIQFSAGCTTNISGFDLRQAQPLPGNEDAWFAALPDPMKARLGPLAYGEFSTDTPVGEDEPISMAVGDAVALQSAESTRHPIKNRAAEMAATLEHHGSIEIGDAPLQRKGTR